MTDISAQHGSMKEDAEEKFDYRVTSISAEILYALRMIEIADFKILGNRKRYVS